MSHSQILRDEKLKREWNEAEYLLWDYTNMQVLGAGTNVLLFQRPVFPQIGTTGYEWDDTSDTAH